MRTPLIRFKYGKRPTQQVSSSAKPQQQPTQVKSFSQSLAKPQQPHTSTKPDGTTVVQYFSFVELPAKYHRHKIGALEMDAINAGAVLPQEVVKKAKKE